MQLIDLLGKYRDLVQIKASNIAHRVRELGYIVVDHASDGFDAGRPLCDDKSKLCQMAAQCVDELCALSNEGLVSSERHRASLMFSALHGHIMNVRAQRSLGNRYCVSRIILLPLDEWLE